MDSEASLREAIVDAARRMRDAGLVAGTSGNVSARAAHADQFWITPSGVDPSKLNTQALVKVGLDGAVLEGGLRPSIDTMNHAAIYRRRDDVASVIHTHSTFATVFAVLRREIPALLAEAAGYLGGAVPVMAYLPPASPDQGAKAADGLGAGQAVLLPNHGVIAVGDSVESAFTAALLVEQAARVAYLSTLLGAPVPLPAGAMERVHRFLREEYGQRS